MRSQLSQKYAIDANISLQKGEVFHERYLEGGMRCLLVPRHFAPLVSVQLWVNTGSMDEESTEDGLAHVLEHMLFKGSKNYPEPGSAATLIESAGGDVNAYTSFEETVYYFNSPKEFLEEGTQLLLDMVLRSKLDQGELTRELEVVQEEIKQGKDSPSRVVSQNLFKSFYEGTTRGRPVIGFVETVAAFDEPKVRHFYEKWYKPNNMTLVICGDFETNRMDVFLNSQSKFFSPGSLAVRQTRFSGAEAASQKELTPQFSLVQGPFQDMRFVMALRGPCLESEEAPSWDVFSSILAHGDASRLSRSVRDDEQLVLAVDADTYSPKQPFGMWSLSFYAKVGNASAAILRCLDEVFILADQGPSAEEMQRVVQAVKAERIYALESIEGIARNAGWSLGTRAQLDYENVYLKQLERVSVAEVQAVAQSLCHAIHAEQYSISVAASQDQSLPWSESELKDLLSSWSQSHTETFVQKNGEIDSVDSIATTAAAKSQNALKQTSQKDPEAHQWVLNSPNDKKIHFNWKHIKRLPIVSACFVAQGGGLLDTPNTAGLRQLVAQMLTRGTQKQSYRTFVTELENKSASISAFVSKDLFGIRMDCLKEHADRTLEMLFDCLFRPSFEEDELQKQLSENRDVLISQKDSAGSRMSKILSPLLYPNHSYGLPLMGNDTTLSTFQKSQVVDAWTQMIRSPDKFIFSCAGDFNETKFARKIELEFNRFLAEPLRCESVSKSTPNFLTEQQTRLGFDLLEREQTHVQLALRAYPISDPQRTSLELMTQILGGQGGRLFLDLRDKKSLAYSVGAGQSPHLQAGHCSLHIATATSKVQEALLGLKYHLEEMAGTLASPQELARAKAALLGGQAQSSQHIQTHATRLAMSDAFGNPFDHYTGFEERVQAVTLDSVRDSIAQLLQKHPPIVGMVGAELSWRDCGNLSWKKGTLS
jgi:zinc protease